MVRQNFLYNIMQTFKHKEHKMT